VSLVGDIEKYRFAARNSRARPMWRECAEKHAVFQCCQASVPASTFRASAERLAGFIGSGTSKAIDLRGETPVRAPFSSIIFGTFVLYTPAVSLTLRGNQPQRILRAGAAMRGEGRVPTRLPAPVRAQHPTRSVGDCRLDGGRRVRLGVPGAAGGASCLFPRRRRRPPSRWHTAPERRGSPRRSRCRT
jgi:hypothetical protein